MLNRDECERALEEIELKTTFIEDYNTIPFTIVCELENEITLLSKLIKEHFELIEEYKKVQLEAQRYFDELCDGGWHDKEYQEFKNPQAYKFDDLKENMVLYDKKYEMIIRIFNFHDDNSFSYETMGSEVINTDEFEENRFFPVQMANRKEV